MKKILSIMLAVLMIAGLCTFSAFAADDGIYNTKPVSGDGVATLPEDGSKSGADVVVTINGEVSHRYAVEITFNNPTFVYSTGSVWDVKPLLSRVKCVYLQFLNTCVYYVENISKNNLKPLEKSSKLCYNKITI